MVSDGSVQYVDDARSAFMVVDRAEDPPGWMVNIRIRSWRPAMPLISGPRSTVASTSDVTPVVSGATCSLLIVLFSLCIHSLKTRSKLTVEGQGVTGRGVR